MPPRKKATPAGTDPNATPDPQTTRTVRSSARLASQRTVVAANLDLTTDGATSSKPALKAKTKAAPKPKPASKTAKSASKTRSKRTKADVDDNKDDAPASKKPKTATVDEEEEEEEEEEENDMAIDTQDEKKDDKKASKKDDKKMVTFTLCQLFVPIDLRVKVTVLQRGAAPVDPYSGMVGQCPAAPLRSAHL